jgi:cell division septal protein FtsQ
MKSRLWNATVISGAAIFLLVVGWSSFSAVRYLRTAERFAVKHLSIVGAERLTHEQIMAGAELEVGANIFSIEMDAVRERVEGLRWVRHAFVQRVLPDRIVVKVIERVPIGDARIDGRLYQFDEQAVLLPPDANNTSSFPIVDGFSLGDRDKNVQKVITYRQIMEELQGQTELSQIVIRDNGEVSVVSVSEPQLVDLGNEDFKGRWLRYLRVKAQIRQYPDVVRVDLRFRNQVILKMSSDEHEDEVIWPAKTNSL